MKQVALTLTLLASIFMLGWHGSPAYAKMENDKCITVNSIMNIALPSPIILPAHSRIDFVYYGNHVENIANFARDVDRVIFVVSPPLSLKRTLEFYQSRHMLILRSVQLDKKFHSANNPIVGNAVDRHNLGKYSAFYTIQSSWTKKEAIALDLPLPKAKPPIIICTVDLPADKVDAFVSKNHYVGIAIP